MNPYLATGLAMCAVVIIALIGTGYLAVYFTQRAKRDLALLLEPLASAIDGTADIEEAEVQGTRFVTIVQGRMANAAAGTVRLWQSDLIDSAGGSGWNYVYSRANPKKKTPDAEIDIITESDAVRSWLNGWTVETLQAVRPLATDWLQVEYSPESGRIRVARPMHGRNDIPNPESFLADLEFAQEIGTQNRALQGVNP